MNVTRCQIDEEEVGGWVPVVFETAGRAAFQRRRHERYRALLPG